MEIIEEYGNMDDVNRYRMTARSVTKKGFKDNIDREFYIKAACITQDGEKSIISILTTDGDIMSGNSKTTIDSFHELNESFGDSLYGVDGYRLIVVASVSKSERTFITLQLV